MPKWLPRWGVMETGSALIAALLGSAQDATWVVSRDLTITHFNDAFSRLASRALGVVPSAGISLDALVDGKQHPAVHELWLELFGRALSGRSVVSDAHLLVEGVDRLYSVNGVPVVDQGSVTAAAFSAHDVTDPAAERAHDELLHLIERKSLEWTLTFDAIELPIFITSMDGVIRRLNRAGRDLAGGEYSDIVGRRASSLGHEEPWITIAQCVESVRDSEQPCNAQAYHAASDRSWDIAANWYRNPDDHAPRAIVALRETTTIVRLQESVRRGEQLAALGELVAGVAHEVKNPIFGMQLTVDALEALLPQEHDVNDLVVALRRWLDRLNRLMESLLAYGKTWSVDLRDGDLAGVVAIAVQTVRQVADAADVVLVTQIDPQLSMLMDASRLGQAFENLITNAVQHSIAQQPVTITAHAEGGVIECIVRDEGPGFTLTDLPRVFEPFFTRRRGGTGLGLSIVQRIVEEHGGTIRAENGERCGAVITMRFPIYTSTNTNAQRILIVDDEELIVMAMCRYFQTLGFIVDTAQQLEEAQSLLGGHPYDLVIADLRLTGFDGVEGLQVVTDAHQRSPRTRVIVLTAFGTPEIEQESYDRGADVFLHKPKAMTEIADVAVALLERR